MAVRFCTRPLAPRLERSRFRPGSAAKIVAVLAILAGGGVSAFAPASAQELKFPVTPSPIKKSVTLDHDKAGQKRMLVQAREIDYDYTRHRVSAVGGVQIYHGR